MFDPATTTLHEVLDHAWAQLEVAVARPEHGFHWPVASSVDAAGEPAARVVVLRRCDRSVGELVFHTDRRSPKVAQLSARPEIAFTFHDSATRLQIRAQAIAEIVTGGAVFDAAWNSVGLGSRRCYLAPAPPSSRSDTVSPNLPEHLRGATPQAEEVEHGRPNFAVVVGHVRRFDVLRVQRQGHVRAGFEFERGQLRASYWLEP